MTKKKSLIPNIVSGGVAIPIRNNMFLMKGRRHKDGGIKIGANPKTGYEVENNEVLQVNNKGEVKVFSAQPFLYGEAPADKVLKGENPNNVFQQQEQFKDVNRIKNDGTRYGIGGKHVTRYSNYIKNRIAKWEGVDYTNGKNRDIDLEWRDYRRRFTNKEWNSFSQAQHDAMFSYSYNAGNGAFHKDSYKARQNRMKALESGNKDLILSADKQVAATIYRGYNRTNLPGLRKRRDEERKIYLGADYNKNDYRNNTVVKKNKPIINKDIQEIEIEPVVEQPINESKVDVNKTVVDKSNVEDNKTDQNQQQVSNNNFINGYGLYVNNLQEINDMYPVNKFRYGGKSKNKSTSKTNYTKEDFRIEDTFRTLDGKLINSPITKGGGRNFDDTDGVIKNINVNKQTSTNSFTDNDGRLLSTPDVRTYYRTEPADNDNNKTNINNTNTVTETKTDDNTRDFDNRTISINYKTPVAKVQGLDISKAKIPNISNIDNKTNWFKKTGAYIKDGISSVLSNKDAVSTGANILGSLISYGVNKSMLNKMRPPVAPVALQAAKLKTEVNVNPELDKIREMQRDAQRSTDANTSSSRVALARIGEIGMNSMLQTNAVHADKENRETALINQDRLNRQSVASQNVDRWNAWRNETNNFHNTINEKKAENKVALINGINQPIQDIILRQERRDALRNNTFALMAANPNVTPEYAYANGLISKTDFDNLMSRKKQAQAYFLQHPNLLVKEAKTSTK